MEKEVQPNIPPVIAQTLNIPPVNPSQNLDPPLLTSQPQSTQPISNPVVPIKEGGKKIVYIIASLLLISIIGFAIYLFLPSSSSITDRQYGFRFNNISGWSKISPRNNAYLSLATKGSNQSIASYAEVRVQTNKIIDENSTVLLSQDQTSTIAQLCQQTDKEEGSTYIGVEKLEIPGTNSYKCTSEGVGVNTDGNILVMENYFIMKPKYNLLISTSYQKNLPQEAQNVKKLMDNFQSIDSY